MYKLFLNMTSFYLYEFVKQIHFFTIVCVSKCVSKFSKFCDLEKYFG